MKNAKVLIVDDNKFMASCMKKVTSEIEGMEVVGTADSGLEAIAFAHDNEVNLVLMDISMPGMNGIEASRYFASHFPDTRILAVSMNDDEDVVLRALNAGAHGYILKSNLFEDIEAGIRAVMEGNSKPFLCSGLQAICSQALQHYAQAV